MHRAGWLIPCLLAGWFALAGGVSAESEVIEKPFPFASPLIDGGRVSGRMVAFDAQGFELADKDGATSRVAWDQVPTERVFDVHRRLIPADDGEGWLKLGQALREREDGERHAEAALARAIKIDPELADRAQAIRDGKTQTQAEGNASLPASAEDAGVPAAPPHMLGRTQADFWGELPAELMASSVKSLKDFAERSETTLGIKLRLHETDNFLFYSDLDAQEAKFWASELEAMYARLCEMFDIDKQKNIFRGKCLIFVFQKPEDYHRFQREMHNTDSGQSAGMCHGFGDGYVHVAFYRDPDRMRFAHVLVHESVHGFLHRYRSPVHIPSWINEGLAEVVSMLLVPKSTIHRGREAEAKREMKQRGNVGGMLDAKPIEGWQYGIARLLTEFMIAQDRKRYVAFVNAIKDGKPWRTSLEEDYGIEPLRLLDAFGKAHELRTLEP